MKSRALVALGRRWQRRLRLWDWRIGFQFDGELDADLAGCVEFDADAREALVRIARRCEDVEATVIHELLHLHVDAVGTTAREQGINAIADALLGRW